MIAGPLRLFSEVGGGTLALALFPGTFELLLLTVAGIFRPRARGPSKATHRYQLTIVIPAHDEELSIGRCIASVKRAATDGVGLRLVVVADNCRDATAEIARAAGAEVVTRNDPDHRGKGYALNFAFEKLAETGADGFAVIDADSEIESNFVIETAAALQAGASATQCRYLVRNRGSEMRTRLMRLALAAYNVLRPRGRAALGLSSGLFGNGFALSAATLRAVPYKAYSVVEDMEYHLALLAAARPVRFLDQTSVYADMPIAGDGVANQRARWEGGRLRVACTQFPGLFKRVLRGEFSFLEPALDLLLPPLAFHVVLLTVTLLTPIPLVRGFAALGLLIVLLHLTVASFVAGKGLRDLTVLAAAPFYVVWKLLLIPKLHQSSKSNAEWVRTERAAGVRGAVKS